METYLMHYGIKGQKWGIRRYQNEDGSYTEEGKRRYKGIKGFFKKGFDINMANFGGRAGSISKEESAERGKELLERYGKDYRTKKIVGRTIVNNLLATTIAAVGLSVASNHFDLDDDTMRTVRNTVTGALTAYGGITVARAYQDSRDVNTYKDSLKKKKNN